MAMMNNSKGPTLPTMVPYDMSTDVQQYRLLSIVYWAIYTYLLNVFVATLVQK